MQDLQLWMFISNNLHFMTNKMMLRNIFFLFLVVKISAEINDGKSFGVVFGKIKSGIEAAGKWLGLDQSKGVTQLVSEAFGKYRRTKLENYNQGDSGVFGGFLRVLGFDAKKIGAIAVNAIIFVAQLIGTSFINPFIKPEFDEARKLPPKGTPLEWVKQIPYVAGMMDHIKDKNLPFSVINHIKENSLDEETDCLQLLVCKSSPFLWAMQGVLKSNYTSKGKNALVDFLPSFKVVEENGDKCEEKHPYCFIDL